MNKNILEDRFSQIRDHISTTPAAGIEPPKPLQKRKSDANIDPTVRKIVKFDVQLKKARKESYGCR